METASSSLVAPGCARCPAARLAERQPLALRKLKAGWRSLAALFAPGIAFGGGLVFLASRGGADWAWLATPTQWPWELWLIAITGSVATVGGMADWAYHRWIAGCAVGPAERRCELLAMSLGGGPLFLFMSVASFSARPLVWLLPSVAVVIMTTAMICYDEFVFHRKRCRTMETLLHRVLVFGQCGAWMAWAHWCFVRGGIHGMA